jgi:hypothetical protein
MSIQLPSPPAKYNDITLPIADRNKDWMRYEKEQTDKGFFKKLDWKMKNKPLDLLCKCDLKKIMYSLAVGCMFYTYTVVFSHVQSHVAFVLAILNWTCLGLQTNLLRLFLYYKQTSLIMNFLFLSQLINALVAILGVIVVCLLDISETTSGSFGKANLAIYILMNTLNIIGNVVGTIAFDSLRQRLYAQDLKEESYITNPIGSAVGSDAITSHHNTKF